MISRPTRQHLLTVMCLIAVLGTRVDALIFQDQDANDSSSSSMNPPPALTPFSSSQLDAMVAPIALYPDALVAQILAAALYPDQIAFADSWVSQNGSLNGSALVQAVDQQPWDPSVKALTQFPSVLHDLGKNLAWTSNLGQAFENQQSDTMAAVQFMRAKAQAAGTLQSTTQINVVRQNPQTIVIQPANPQVVYVPQYNPAVVYGSPFVVPLYTPPVTVATAAVSFGAGIAIGAGFGGGGIIGGGGGFSWGFSSWNCNWGGGGGGGNVVYNHNTYVNKTVINKTNNNYNNYHPWGPGSTNQGPNGPHPYSPNGSRPNTPSGNNGYRPAGYAPNGGANGNRGLIGGNGGTQHLIGGNGGVQRGPNNANANRFGNTMTSNQQQRPPMAGNGNQARAEANRGIGSMQRGGGGGRPQGAPRAAPARSR
jgi:hypothetical protein